MYDPGVGRGAMTRYDPDVVYMFHWKRVGQDSDPLFLFDGDQNLYRLDQAYTEDTVDAGAGPVSTRIDAFVRTGWITAGETATGS